MRKRIRPYLFWILLAFLATGLVYPAVGIIALTCMIAPVAVAPFRGRYWCGNYCPRGSFYDHVLVKLSPQRKIPAFFSHTVFRAVMVLFIMSVFTVQMIYAWGDWAAMGKVFVQIILITTIVGIVLGLIYHQRTWCSFCPMGTLASSISRRKKHSRWQWEILVLIASFVRKRVQCSWSLMRLKVLTRASAIVIV